MSQPLSIILPVPDITDRDIGYHDAWRCLLEAPATPENAGRLADRIADESVRVRKAYIYDDITRAYYMDGAGD